MKVVINDCFGGFSVSEKAKEMLGWDSVYDCESRDDPELIRVVEQLGEEANGAYANLEIVEIPDEATDWRIFDYDGAESVWYVLDGKMKMVV